MSWPPTSPASPTAPTIWRSRRRWVGRCAGRRWTRRYFKPAALAVGLPERLRLYDLRHTCASLLIREGATVKAVQAQLGRATASITLDTYGHLFPDELDQLASRLEAARAEALEAQQAARVWPRVAPRLSSSAKVQVNDLGGQRRRWDSKPPPRCSGDRGQEPQGTATCDSFIPVVTAPARPDPQIPDAVRTQHGPGHPITFGGTATADLFGWALAPTHHERPRHSLAVAAGKR